MQARAGLLCPVCQMELAGSERDGVAIASCPLCCGAWLERDELAKLMGTAGPRPEGRIREHDRPSLSRDAPAPRPWHGALFDVD